jgi:hypothetical protein
MTLPACIFVELEHFADISQKRAGNEIIEVDRDARAKDLVEHLADRDALFAAGVEVLDETHVDLAREEREGDGADLVKRPPLAAAAGGEGFVPHRGHLVAQGRVFDIHQVRKKGGNVLR